MSKTKQQRTINDMAIAPEGTAFDARPYESLGYGKTGMRAAHDAALNSCGIYNMIHGMYNYPQFMGYSALAGLSQDGVIRAGVTLRADEMTRRWIEFNYNGEASDTDASQAVEAEMTRLKVDRVFREAAEMCGFFGGCLAYIDVGDISGEDMRLPLGGDSDTIKPGMIKGFKIIEPTYIAPGRYSCFNPLDSDYFVPQSWLINGKEVHASRFLYFAEDKPPSLLLPAYNFFGIPLAQTVADNVRHFSECSAAAARLLQKFSCIVFKTDMSDVFNGSAGAEVRKRVQHFAKFRDNDGVEVIDKESEDIADVSTPIGGVTDIVRQQMEIVAAMFGEPAVKLWGISPGGFNSTGESDMKSHYDHVHAIQERIFREPLEYVVKLLQLNTTGAVDDALSFEFIPLSDEDEDLKARCNKTTADTYATLIDRGVISGAEARMALANDPSSGFANIDADEEIELPEMALPLEGGPDEENA